MNDVKLLHIKCYFFPIFQQSGGIEKYFKKFGPQEKVEMTPLDLFCDSTSRHVDFTQDTHTGSTWPSCAIKITPFVARQYTAQHGTIFNTPTTRVSPSPVGILHLSPTVGRFPHKGRLARQLHSFSSHPHTQVVTIGGKLGIRNADPGAAYVGICCCKIMAVIILFHSISIFAVIDIQIGIFSHTPISDNFAPTNSRNSFLLEQYRIHLLAHV